MPDLNFDNLLSHLKEYFLFHQKYKLKVIPLLLFEKKLEEFLLDNKYNPVGLVKIKTTKRYFQMKDQISLDQHLQINLMLFQKYTNLRTIKEGEILI